MKVLRQDVALFLLGLSVTLCSGAGNSNTCSGDLTVYSQFDLDMLSDCRSYTGTITIESTPALSLMLSGVAVLNGDVLVKNNTALGHIIFPNLQAVNGTLRLSDNLVLSKLDWPSLTALKELELSVLLSLSAVSFPSGLSKASKITVSDTTATRIDGLMLSTIAEITIDNNQLMKKIDLGDNLKQVTTAISIGANSPELILNLPHLKELQQGTLSNLGNVSLEGLETVHGDLSFLSNHFRTLKVPKLANIDGTLTFTDNSKLEKLSIPELRRLGGALSFRNNTHLTLLDAFPKLEEVDGTLDLAGSFNEVKLANLQNVRGGLNVQTSSNTFSCDGINSLRNGVIKGNEFVCLSGVADPKSVIHKSSIDHSGTPANIKSHPAHVVLCIATLLALCIL